MYSRPEMRGPSCNVDIKKMTTTLTAIISVIVPLLTAYLAWASSDAKNTKVAFMETTDELFDILSTGYQNTTVQSSNVVTFIGNDEDAEHSYLTFSKSDEGGTEILHTNHQPLYPDYVRIFDEHGKPIEYIDNENGRLEDGWRIDISDYEKGRYLVQVKENNNLHNLVIEYD